MHTVELISTGDRHNGNTRQYRNYYYAWVGCTERTLVVFCVCVCVCSASVNALQIVFSNILYVSTAKWEIPQIFKEDRLLVHI